MAGLDPAIPIGSVAACDCLFRDAGAGGDARDKPGHDGGGAYVTLFDGWYQIAATVLRPPDRANASRLTSRMPALPRRIARRASLIPVAISLRTHGLVPTRGRESGATAHGAHARPGSE